MISFSYSLFLFLCFCLSIHTNAYTYTLPQFVPLTGYVHVCVCVLVLSAWTFMSCVLCMCVCLYFHTSCFSTLIKVIWKKALFIKKKNLFSIFLVHFNVLCALCIYACVCLLCLYLLLYVLSISRVWASLCVCVCVCCVRTVCLQVLLGEVTSGLSSNQVVVKELKTSASIQDQMHFLEEAQPYR